MFSLCSATFFTKPSSNRIRPIHLVILVAGIRIVTFLRVLAFRVVVIMVEMVSLFVKYQSVVINIRMIPNFFRFFFFFTILISSNIYIYIYYFCQT